MGKKILCGHCKLYHQTVSEIRSCSQGGSKPTPKSSRQQASVSGRAIQKSVEELAGVASLGRSVVLSVSQAVPSPWKGAPEIKIGEHCDADQVSAIAQNWLQRTRVIYRWCRPDPVFSFVVSEKFFELSPDFLFDNERLFFFVFANAVNCLTEKPSFPPLTRAAELGAVRSDLADVETSDKQHCWVDGGPLQAFSSDDLDSFSLIPRVHLLRGLLDPLQPADTSPTFELAEDQKKAVTHSKGAASILAPAGSGKTRVLVERVKYLTDVIGVAPQAITLVAYNRRAREEMSARLPTRGVTVRTLNSLALALVHGAVSFGVVARKPTIITEMEVRSILESVVPATRRRSLTDPFEVWVDALSACRLGLKSPAEIEKIYGNEVAGFSEVFEKFQEHLRQRNLLDFDEQIIRAIEILLEEEAFRTHVRQKIPILCVDEFQDLTPAHLLLVRLLVGVASEVFAVGDDDQTIYGYSGASPEWLVNFSEYFPHALQHKLCVNYRCPQDVVSAASNLLSYNQHRVEKDPRAHKQTKQTKKLLAPFSVSISDETGFTLNNHVEKLLSQGAEPREIAVLARVNAVLLSPLLYLQEIGIPCISPVGVGVQMLERMGVHAALAWLDLAVSDSGDLSAESLRTAFRRPPRSVHPKIVDWVCEQRSVSDLRSLASRLKRGDDGQKVREFARQIQFLQKQADDVDTAEILEYIYKQIGLMGATTKLDGSQRCSRRPAHTDELVTLKNVALLEKDPRNFHSWLYTSLQNRIETHDNAVLLGTIHTTKGLEWPHVIVQDVRDDLFPHHLSDDIEEERRILHVAITRGSSTVFVNGANPPSRFISEFKERRDSSIPWPSTVVRSLSAPQSVASSALASATSTRKNAASPQEQERREALTVWRKQKAKEDSVPAYIVLNNRTLDAIASSAPSDITELASIAGIGPVKVDRYGEEIVAVVMQGS